MRPKRWTLVTLALILALTTLGAGVAVAQDQSSQAALRAVHAVPGGPAVDVFVDGNRVFSSVSYKTATDYAALSAGQHTVRVVQAGAGAQGQALIDTTVTLNPDSYNTLAAVGETSNIQALELTDDSTLPTINEARVRVVHASPNAPAVDVVVQGGPVLFQGVSFPSASDYKVVGAQTYTLEIRQAGTNNVVKTIPDVSLNGATVYSIYAVGLVNGQPPLEALVVVDAPPLPACRALVSAQAAPTATARATRTPTAVTPTTGTPTTGTPTTGTPTTGTPTTGTPTTGTPTTGTPTTATPTTGTPTTGTPTTGTPTTGTPTTGTPTTGTPTTGTPTTGTPTTTTPVGSATPQATMSPTGTMSQSASAQNPAGHASVGALLQVGLSLAAVLGGMALTRRLF